MPAWARGRLHDPAAGAAELRQALAARADQGQMLDAPFFYRAARGARGAGAGRGQRARAHRRSVGSRRIKSTIVAISPSLHRLRGEILLKRDPANPAPAEEAFLTAIAVAKQQGARSFGLRASLSLAKLYQSTGRPVEAHAVLAPALEGFSPTPEMPEIAEAQALLAALAQTDEVKTAEAQRQRRLDLHTSYGKALMWGKGFIAEETKAAFARVGEMAGTTDNSAARFIAYDSQYLGHLARGECRLARETAEEFLREAEAEGRAMEAGVARRLAGFVSLMQGDLNAARAYLERALADCNPERDAQARLVFGRDPEAVSAANLGVVAWHLGEVDWACGLINRAIRRADALGPAASIVLAHFNLTLLQAYREDLLAARGAAEDVIRLTQQFGIKYYDDVAQIFASWARGRLLDPEAGARELAQALAAYIAQGNKVFAPLSHGFLAELETKVRGPESALALIEQGLAIADETGEHLTDPYLYRLRGDVLLKRNPDDRAPAENAYRTSIAIAKQQGARSWGLRAALALAKLYQSTGRPADAHAVLAPALEGFAPTPEMPEIAEARALLDALAATDAVKAAADSRRQRVHLQTSYGKALIGVHGYGAPETALAFERARELATGLQATGLDDSIDRFPATYGVWVGTHVRGELLSMRELAATFLRESASRPNSGEASVGHRIMGATHWFAAEFVEARAHLEQAVAIFDPSRDADLAFRYGQDIGVSASAYSAIALWPLGEIDLSRRRADDAVTRARSSGHVATAAYGLALSALYRLLIRDPEGAQPIAAQLGKAAEDLQSPQYLAFHDVLGGWPAWRSGSGESALLRIRRGIAQLKGQGIRTWAPLTEAMLAEVESETGDSNSAMVTIARTIAEAERLGQRWYDAELHRIRGEILLKQAPSVPAPAEEAFLTAIAIAQAARHAQLRTARRALARQTLPIDRPPRRRPRRPSAGARRLFADARNARDRRGAGAAHDVGGDGGGQSRCRAEETSAAPTDSLWSRDDVVHRLR